jgi:hypothetical protein
MTNKKNYYYLDEYDLKIIIDSLQILHKQMLLHQQLGIETSYSQADVEMILEALKNSQELK